MEVSWVIGVPPVILSNGIFHYSTTNHPAMGVPQFQETITGLSTIVLRNTQPFYTRHQAPVLLNLWGQPLEVPLGTMAIEGVSHQKMLIEHDSQWSLPKNNENADWTWCLPDMTKYQRLHQQSCWLFHLHK